MGAALAGALGTFAVVTPAWADNTTLAITYNAAAYKVAATGTAPALSVPGAQGSGSSDTSQPETVPTVAPGQPLTVTVQVNAANVVNEGTIAFQLDGATLATVNVTPQTVFIPIPVRVVGGVVQPTGPARAPSTATVGQASYTFRVPAGSHSFVVRYSGGVHFSSNVYGHSIDSMPHTALDLACGCQQSGTPFGTCYVSGLPKTPPAQTLVCKSNIWAEFMVPNNATSTWGPGPAGAAQYNVPGIGIVSGRTAGVGTNSVTATASMSVPAAQGTITITSSFQATTPAQGAASTGPSTTLQVVWPQ
jgi:hypothetical protein